MQRWGVWTENDGGFCAGPCDTEAEAQSLRAWLIRYTDPAGKTENTPEDQADAAKDMTVVEMCGWHEEQPAVGCEDCDTDEQVCEEDGVCWTCTPAEHSRCEDPPNPDCTCCTGTDEPEED